MRKLAPAYLDRVSGWVEQALAKPTGLTPKSKHLLLIGLGNIRERQGNYQKAEALYERAIRRRRSSMEHRGTTLPG